MCCSHTTSYPASERPNCCSWSCTNPAYSSTSCTSDNTPSLCTCPSTCPSGSCIINFFSTTHNTIGKPFAEATGWLHYTPAKLESWCSNRTNGAKCSAAMLKNLTSVLSNAAKMLSAMMCNMRYAPFDSSSDGIPCAPCSIG